MCDLIDLCSIHRPQRRSQRNNLKSISQLRNLFLQDLEKCAEWFPNDFQLNNIPSFSFYSDFFIFKRLFYEDLIRN
jgi:hypothetical protein